MIAIRNLGFEFEDGPTVFEDLSATIETGQTVAVLGANGTGKTTLLRLLAGLIEPTAGEIHIDGRDEPAVGLAPETPADGLFAQTVESEVAFFPTNRGLAVDEQVQTALKQLDIEHLADRDPYSLSEGEKRLVTIAAVHSGNPDVMALDEPTSGLDMPGWKRLGERIETIDGTVLFVTHDTDFAWRYADSVLVLSEAGLERQGPAEDVLADPAFDLESVGLTTPSPVVWARNREIEPPPTTVTEALTLLEDES